jgi:hypothetical protein
LKKTRPSPRRTEPILPAVIDIRAEADSLLTIYNFMTQGHRKEKFTDVNQPSVMTEAIVGILSRPETEHHFLNLQHALGSSPQADLHFANAVVFLTALSGSNNEFAASRRIVFFARRMMESDIPAPIPRNESRSSRKAPRSGPAFFVSVATQTPSMLTNCLVIREGTPKRAKGRRPMVECVDAFAQTESLHRAASSPPSVTVSYPYGALSGGFVPSVRKPLPRPSLEPPLTTRRIV